MKKYTLFTVSAVLATLIYIETYEAEQPVPISPMVTVNLQLPEIPQQATEHSLSDTQSIENSTKIHFDKDLLAGPDDSQKISATEPDLVNVNNDS